MKGRNQLPLSLLMLRIFADDATRHLPLAIAPNDEAAILAYLLHGSADFHKEDEGESP